MPYCSECGAKYAAGAAECPMCGAPTMGEGSRDAGTSLAPAGGEEQWEVGSGTSGDGTFDPVERFIACREELVVLSALQRQLTDDDFASQSPNALDVRDRLAAVLEESEALTPEAEVTEAHELITNAARDMLRSFDVMTQLSWPGAMLDDASRAEAQQAEQDAVDALGQAGDLLAALIGVGLSEEAPAEEGPMDLETEMEAVEPPLPPAPRPPRARVEVERIAELPPLEPAIFASYPEPPALERSPAPLPVSETAEALDDPLGEALEWEVTNHWAQQRVDFYRQLDRVVQAALSAALRAALDMRARARRDAQMNVERLHHQRSMLLDDIEALRRERERLRDETSRLRIDLESLERTRVSTEGEQQQMLREARMQRARLLGDVEALTTQLTELHRAVTSLPGLEQAERPAAPRHVSPPSAERAAPTPELPATAARGRAVDESPDGRRMSAAAAGPETAAMLDVEPELQPLAGLEEIAAPTEAEEEEVSEAAPPPRTPPAPRAVARGEAPSAAPAPRPAAPRVAGPLAASPGPAMAQRPAAPLRPAGRPTPQRPAAPAPEPAEAGADADDTLASLLRELGPAEQAASVDELAQEMPGMAAGAAERPKTGATPAAGVAPIGPAGVVTTEIRILGPNVIRQRPQFWMAVKGLQGVRSVVPRVEEGALVLRAQHERGADLIEDLVSLPGMNLKLVSASFPERIELSL